ncbi:MAG: hypothetical protein HC906_01355 [Bacteroidales bacterium]|nr:hypothetical protein [Bacteroidales bacterium]
MAPRRMELITTPPQNLDALDWYKTLALHEYRHVAQISQMKKGFTSALRFVIGETAYGLPALEIPLWMIEGDAVVTETILSENGRGRTADFLMPVIALHREKKIKISYDKSYFGSYKDFTPNHYELGYQLNSYSRLVYGEDVGKKLIGFASSRSFIPFSFNLGLKKCTTRH